jgi:hypothetical protein
MKKFASCLLFFICIMETVSAGETLLSLSYLDWKLIGNETVYLSVVCNNDSLTHSTGNPMNVYTATTAQFTISKSEDGGGYAHGVSLWVDGGGRQDLLYGDGGDGSFTVNLESGHYFRIQSFRYDIAAYEAIGSVYRFNAYVDSTGPSISISGAQDNWYYNGSITLTADASDNISGVNTSTWRYKIGSGSWQSGYSVSMNEADGVSKTVTFSVRDGFGNEGTKAVTVTFDKTSPYIEGGSPTQVSSGVQVSTILKDTVGLLDLYTYSILKKVTSWGLLSTSTEKPFPPYPNGNRYLKACTDTRTWPVKGSYRVELNVKDVAGNSAVTKIIEFKYPNANPRLSLDPDVTSSVHFTYTDGQGTHHGFRANDLKVQAMDALDEEVDAYASIDGGSSLKLPRPNATNQNNLHLDDGTHIVAFQAFDAAGNQLSDIDHAARTWVIDTTPPVIQLSYPDPNSSGSTVTLVSAIEPYYVPSSAAFTDSSFDAASGLSALTFRMDGEQIGNPIPSVFTPAMGRHSYIFTATDNAGNASSVECIIVSNPGPVTLAPVDANGLYPNVFYANDSASGTSMALPADKPINSTRLWFQFAADTASGQGPRWGGSYAPPSMVTVSVDGASSITYTFSANTERTFASDPMDIGPLSDGPHQITYTLTDASGLSSANGPSTPIRFSLHKRAPDAVSSGMLSRFSESGTSTNLWTKDAATGIGTLHSTDAVLAAAGDTLVIGYDDAGLPGELHAASIGLYVIEIVDPIHGSTMRSYAAEGITYPLSWQLAETSRVISVRVIDDTGKSSPQRSILLFKPAWGSGPFGSPSRLDNPNGSLAGVHWQHAPSGNGIGGVYWGIGALDAATWTWEDAGGTGVTLLKSAVVVAGVRIAYQTGIRYSAQPEQADIVQEIRVLGSPASYAVPYAPIPRPALAMDWIGARGSFDLSDTVAFPAMTPDENNIFYQFEMGMDNGSGGFDTSHYPVRVMTRGPGDPPQLPFSLWDLCGLDPGVNSVVQLKALLGGKRIVLKMDQWITGSKPSDFGDLTGWTPDTAQQTAMGTAGSLAWDVDPPSILLAGMMEGLKEITSSPIASGTAGDTGGSGLKSVSLSYTTRFNGDGTPDWTAITGLPAQSTESFSFMLTEQTGDGRYAIQLKALDAAGNASSVTQTRIIDTKPPLLDSFQFAAGTVTDSHGSVVARADGSVRADVIMEDGGGVGLGSVQYVWKDDDGNDVSQPGQAVVSPSPGTGFDGFHAGPETYALSFGGAPTGVGILCLRLVDKAGNSSGDLSGGGLGWRVVYDAAVPDIAVTLGGTRLFAGRYWVRQASDLSAECTALDGAQQGEIAAVRWNVQRIVNGLVDGADAWSDWGAGFDSVRYRVADDGQSYRVQAQARNENGVTGPIVTSPTFTQDGIGPRNVTASLAGAGTSFLVNQAIRVDVGGSDAYGVIGWTWTSVRKDGTGTAVTQEYRLGSDIVLASTGAYEVVFTATSGSGISASAAPIALAISGTGLAVNDNQRYTSGTGTIAGRWTFVGGSPTSYSCRWLRKGDQAVLSDWAVVGAATSSVADLASTGVTLATGEVVVLAVRAYDGEGNVMAESSSAGSTVDASPPEASVTAAPGFVPPNNAWVAYTCTDADSGIVGGSVLVKRMRAATDGSWSGWTPIMQRNLAAAISGTQRVDLDLSAGGAAVSGDRVVIEVSLENGAGLASTVESGIIIMDGSPPPAPEVITTADAVRYKPMQGDSSGRYQTLGFDWRFTSPDPESGTTKYYWKAYTSTLEMADNPWTPAAEGRTEVGGLDYSQVEYGNVPGPYEDGTMIYFAVKAVNGAGLENIGYSTGVVLDSTAPWVCAVTPMYEQPADPPGPGRKIPIDGYVPLASLGNPPTACARQAAEDFGSGVRSFQIQAGTWSAGTGFVAVGEPVAFTTDPGSAEGQYSPSIELGPDAASLPAEAIWRIRGTAFDAAGNETVLVSAGFRIISASPTLTALQGNLGERSVSFSWNVDKESDFVKGYMLSLVKIPASGGIPIPVLLEDADGRMKTSIVLAQKVWNGDWKALGFQEGDSVQMTVGLLTGLGSGSTVTASLAILPYAPALASFDYTCYFSSRFNVKAVGYAVPVPQGVTAGVGIQQIQWRLRDALSGQLMQDWTPDYSGASTSWTGAYTALILDQARIPVDGQTLFLEIRAESQMGIWSAPTTSRIILVDATPAVAGAVTRGSAYSNARGNTGVIDGWSLAGHDGQSGVIRYRAALSASPDQASIDWDTTPSIEISDPLSLPGVQWSAEGVGIAGAVEQRAYYAFVRLQNGTEDWGPAAMSAPIDVNWTPPAIGIVFAPSVFARRDSTGNAVTNGTSEAIVLTSSKPGTAFAFFVNGTLAGDQPATVEGSPGVEGSVRSYGSVTVTGPGTLALGVTGRDIYGNQSTVEDSLRFNQAPAVAIVGGGGRVRTTPGKSLTLENLVVVSDDDRDYPLSYSWNIGSGIPLNFTGSQTETRTVSAWPDSGFNAAYFQNGHNQQTDDVLILTVSDAWGKTRIESLPLEVHNTDSGTLYTNEYWTGSVALKGMVQVPYGVTLTLDSVTATVSGAVGAEGVLDGGIVVEYGGALGIGNSSTVSTFSTAYLAFNWRGIMVSGSLSGSGLEVRDAERGLALRAGGSMTLGQAVLANNLIGLHLLGGSLALTNSAVTGNKEYGVKEDGSGDYMLRYNTFSSNGVDYYRVGVTLITLGELNALSGNEGNR